MKFVDSHMNPDPKKVQPWLLTLDVCPVHVSKKFRADLSEQFPHVKTAYVEPGRTASSQPLDVGGMRPFKTSLRRSATLDLSKMVLENID